MGLARIGTDDYTPFPFDHRIKYTVGAILNDFIGNYFPKSILVISYDDSDGKRFRHFHPWFENLNSQKDLYKEDAAIILPGIEIKMSIIFKAHHIHFHKVLEEFHQAKNMLIEEKQ